MNANDIFISHMDAMRVHYESDSVHGYALPVDVSSFDLRSQSAANDDEGRLQVTTDLQCYKEDANDFIGIQEMAINDSVAALEAIKMLDDDSTGAFASAMNKQKEETKKKSDAIINKNFKKLIETGIRYPKQQKRILLAAQKIGVFFADFLVSANVFFEELGSSVVSFFKNVGEWFRNTDKAIINWTSAAINSIVKFFSSLI